MSDTFADTVRNTLRQNVPDIAGSRVIVALSGGADSVALCHFLVKNAEELQITVEAAHLNHGLRGQESDADEQFVRALCREWGIPLVCERLVTEKAHPSEAELREKRYEFLWRAAGGGYLATAHTLTDSCETLLLHLARGARLGGLRGIPPRRGRLLRPLLGLTREQIEAYCRENGLIWREDSSNATDAYARNRLRHGALPALRSVNPAAERAMEALMQEAGELYSYLDAQAAGLLAEAALSVERSVEPGEKVEGCWDTTILSAAPDVLLRHALGGLLAPYGDRSAARIRLAAECVRSGGAVEWCAGVRLRCRNGRVTIGTVVADQPENVTFCVPACEGVFHCAPGVTVRICRRDVQPGQPEIHVACENGEIGKKNRKIHKKDLNNCLDCDKISAILSARAADGEDAVPELRFRREKDRFRPGRGRGEKSLRKWFNEIACPVEERGRLPLLAVGSQVLWLAGSGAAEGFAAAEDAHTVWEIIWQKDREEASV